MKPISSSWEMARAARIWRPSRISCVELGFGELLVLLLVGFRRRVTVTFSEEVWFIMSIRGTRVMLFLSEMSLLSYRQYTHRVLTTNQLQNSEHE